MRAQGTRKCEDGRPQTQPETAGVVQLVLKKAGFRARNTVNERDHDKESVNLPEIYSKAQWHASNKTHKNS